MKDVEDSHCLGELEVAAIFSNGGKDRDMAQLFIVQFE
jgi:hypothetical protein